MELIALGVGVVAILAMGVGALCIELTHRENGVGYMITGVGAILLSALFFVLALDEILEAITTVVGVAILGILFRVGIWFFGHGRSLIGKTEESS